MLKYIFLLITFPLFSQIQRIEPPFWWADMHRETIEVMVYHPQISSFDVKTSNGISLKTKKTENPNYLFITIHTKG